MPETAPVAGGPGSATARVVLVVQDEVSERALTARHLRESNFDVIEAAAGDDVRRALDGRHVDVVFADFDMPGKGDGLALLALLREHRLGSRTILTSGSETNVASVEGYGVFLSKPFRMVDLDHCLQRILSAANAAARDATAAISSDRARSDSPSSDARQGKATAGRRPFLGSADSPGDE